MSRQLEWHLTNPLNSYSRKLADAYNGFLFWQSHLVNPKEMTNGLFGWVTEFHYWGNAGCMTNVTESATGYGPCPHFLFHSSTAQRADVWALRAQGYFAPQCFINLHSTFVCIFNAFRHMHSYPLWVIWPPAAGHKPSVSPIKNCA